MITVTIYESDDLIVGCKVKGHSEYAEYGNDVVCAFVSSAVIMTANTITEILHINADVTDKDGFVSINLSSDDAPEAQSHLKGMVFHLSALSEQYPKNIKLKFSEV